MTVENEVHLDMTTNYIDICCVNIRSLSDSKVDSLKIDIAPEFDIICLTETNLPHANVHSTDIVGFQHLLTKDRTDRQGGGVGVYVADHIGVTRKEEFEIPGLELLWVNIKAGSNKFLLGICYRPPNTTNIFWNKLQDSLDLAKQAGYRDIVLSGDLNADPATREGRMLKYVTNSNNMYLHINEPTRITPRSATVLDQFITTCPELVINTDVLSPISTCDHCPISMTIKFKNSFKKKMSYYRYIWLYDKANFSAFRDELRAANWESCFESNDPTVAAVMWTEMFMNISRRVIPNKSVLVRPDDKDFYNAGLRTLRRAKNRAHNKAKSKNTPEAWENFRNIRNKYNDKINEAKRDQERKKLDALKDPDNLAPKQWWSIANSILNRRPAKSYPPLVINGNVITNDEEKAKIFNEYFVSFSNLIMNNSQIPLASKNPSHVLSEVVISENEVIDLLKCIKANKSPGPDLVTSMLLKQAGSSIVPSLTKLFNLSLSNCSFPQSWKKANVVPIFKKDDNSNPTNYRPVSLLSCIAKLFERAIFKHVFNFLREHKLISIKQSGFIPGDSTVYQLTHLYHLFSQSLDQQKDIRIVFCDISKAFDRVWHDGLLTKLKEIGIQGNLLSWFRSYLTNRSQRVTIDGQESPWLNITAGVPQGSVLGPLLFLIYINDIASVVQNEIRLFADDTILYMEVDSPSVTAQSLNSDLNSMMDWADKWLIKFSPPKTVTLNLSKKRKKLPRPPLVMNTVPVRNVDSHKHLGVTLASDLSWNEHINNLAVSANRLIDVFNVFKYKLDRRSLEKLYFTFVRSKLEYASIVWDNCPQYLINLLEDVQLRAAKVICGATNRTSRALIYKELGWQTLQTRRKDHRLATMYKIMHNSTPDYLCSPIPVNNEHIYHLRNAKETPGVKARTSAFQNSFYPQTIKDWNELDYEIKNAPSIGSFKKKLKETKHKPPDWFYSGDRKCSIIHARMRMLCSSLNEHLYSHLHVIDNPECQCGSYRETAKHFLLECPMFAIERQIMIRCLRELGFIPSFENLLYGSSIDTIDMNIKAVGIIHTFFNSTGRFTN